MRRTLMIALLCRRAPRPRRSRRRRPPSKGGVPALQVGCRAVQGSEVQGGTRRVRACVRDRAAQLVSTTSRVATASCRATARRSVSTSASSRGKGKVPPARLNTAQVELDAILARIARITIVIQGPPYATLFLDGNSLGTMTVPMPLVLPPGEHKIVAKADGYKDAERTLRVASGDEAEISLTLSESPKDPVSVAVTAQTPALETKPKRFSIGAGFGSNLRAVADTGAPSIGVAVSLGSRLQLGVEGPRRVRRDATVRVRLAARDLGARGPRDADRVPRRRAGRRDLRRRFRRARPADPGPPMLRSASSRLASYAGKERGTTCPRSSEVSCGSESHRAAPAHRV